MSSAVKGAKWFSLALVALPIVLLLSAFAIARSNWFVHRALPAYLSGLDAEYQLRNQRCDVLIFGDSSSLTGIDPALLASRTGKQVCDISRTKGETGVLGTWFLTQFLRRNPAPRTIVFAFAPEDWHPTNDWNAVAYVEGMITMLRRAPPGFAAMQIARHPDQAFGFARFVYQSTFTAVLHRHAVHGTDPPLVSGHMTLAKPPQRACLAATGEHATQFMQPDAAYIARLRQQFATAQTRVVLVVSPIPECDAFRDRYAAALAPLVDVTFPAYPVEFYNDLDRHFTTEGSARYSSDLADKLNALPAAN